MAWERFGEVSILALVDATGPFFTTLQEAFPAATSDDFARAAELDPGAFADDGSWLLTFRCFAVRVTDGRTFLIDAGIGPSDSLAAAWAPVPGELPQVLADAGIDSGDVDAVVLTHLHSDHFGWAVNGGTPFFPNATYHLQRADYKRMGITSPRIRGALLDPLEQAGQLHLVDGEMNLASGVALVPTPGHTPGHQSVLVNSGDDHVLVTGDLLVHAVQLADPAITYAHDVDPAGAAATRAVMLSDVQRRRGVLATSHLSTPFVRMPLA